MWMFQYLSLLLLGALGELGGSKKNDFTIVLALPGKSLYFTPRKTTLLGSARWPSLPTPTVKASVTSSMTSYNLTHLKQLEAESIHIIREVAAEFDNPVMLYSVGKDSAVMVRLAEKAFYPAKPPFPMLHVDTTWKFREMIAFRDNLIREELGWDLIVHINHEGAKLGLDPLTQGGKHTTVMKTEGLKQALNKLRCGFWRCSPRRRKIASQGTYLFVSRQKPHLGSKEPTPRIVEYLQHESQPGRKHSGLPDLELD